MQEKSEKFSVSFPASLREAMDRFIGRKARSQYLQELTEADLRKHEALAPDPVARELVRTRELIAARGLEAVKAKHDELSIEAANAEVQEREKAVA